MPETIQTEKWVVAVGNAFDGIRLFGPFDSTEEAGAWTDEIRDEWVLMKLEMPA